MATNKWKKDLPPIPREVIPKEKREAFLEGVANGKGILKTRAALGISERVLKNTVEADPAFADRLRAAKETPKETLEEIIYLQGQIEPEFAMTVLSRMDKQRAATQARKDNAEARRIAAAALGGPSVNGEIPKIDLKRLTVEELRDLKRLTEKAKVVPKAEGEAEADVDGDE